MAGNARCSRPRTAPAAALPQPIDVRTARLRGQAHKLLSAADWLKARTCFRDRAGLPRQLLLVAPTLPMRWSGDGTPARKPSLLYAERGTRRTGQYSQHAK